MTFSSNTDMPTYIVYRNIQPGQPANLAAPLAFFPPLGSDELFDALRAKFPHLKTHSERVGQASLEFFYQEDLTDQASFPTPQTSQSTTVSPWEASLPSFSSEASTWSSPDALGAATPSSSPQTLPLSRQQSCAATTSLLPATVESSPPGLQAMTSVFSLANAVQPKQRIRRKMTETEKADYRKRRIVKACDKCAKRKRKCSHNSDELERISPSIKSQLSISKRPRVPEQPIWQSNTKPAFETVTEFGNPFPTDSLSVIDDLDQCLPDAPVDFNLDEFLVPEQPQWLWSDTPDWTLLDPIARPTTTCGSAVGLGEQHAASQDLALFPELEAFADLHSEQTFHTNANHSLRHENFRQSQLQGHNAQSASPRQQAIQGGQVSPCIDPSLLSDGLIRNAGAPQGERHARRVDDSSREHGLQPTDSSALTERKRNALTMMVTDGRTSSSAPSLTGLQPSTNAQTAPSGRSRTGLEERDESRSESLDISDQSLRAHTTRGVKSTGLDRYTGSAARLALGGLEGRRLLESDVIDEQPDRRRQNTHANIGLGLNNAPGSSSGMLKRTDVKQKRRSLSPGGGLTSSIDPGLQLFMLKRRLTTAVNGSNQASALRLQTIPQVQQHSEHFLPRAGVHDLGESQLLLLQSTFSTTAADSMPASSNAVAHTRPHCSNFTNTERNPTQAGLSMFGVSEERLSDHFRRRDHFGRHASFVSQACKLLAAAGCFLVLLACLLVPVQSLSMVLLALAAPVHDGRSGDVDAKEPTERFSVSGSFEASSDCLSLRIENVSSKSIVSPEMSWSSMAESALRSGMRLVI